MPYGQGQEERVANVSLSNDSAWALTSSGVCFISRGNSDRPQSLSLLRFETGKAQPVAPIDGGIGIGLSVSPDERFVIYSQFKRPASDLMMVAPFP